MKPWYWERVSEWVSEWINAAREPSEHCRASKRVGGASKLASEWLSVLHVDLISFLQKVRSMSNFNLIFVSFFFGWRSYLIREHQNCLHREPSGAEVEEVLQWGSQQIHDQNIVVLFLAEPSAKWNFDVRSSPRVVLNKVWPGCFGPIGTSVFWLLYWRSVLTR